MRVLIYHACVHLSGVAIENISVPGVFAGLISEFLPAMSLLFGTETDPGRELEKVRSICFAFLRVLLVWPVCMCLLNRNIYIYIYSLFRVNIFRLKK